MPHEPFAWPALARRSSFQPEKGRFERYQLSRLDSVDLIIIIIIINTKKHQHQEASTVSLTHHIGR
ncbi:hypothetical protein PG984_006784 [Apiospora sp. TS-2023a]